VRWRGAGGGRGQTAAVQDEWQDEGQRVGKEGFCEELRVVWRGTVPALKHLAQPFLALSESWGSLARTGGASQSAVDFHSKIAGDPHKAWRPNQPRTRAVRVGISSPGYLQICRLVNL